MSEPSLAMPAASFGAFMAALTRLEGKMDALEERIHALTVKVDTHQRNVDDGNARDSLILQKADLLLKDRIQANLQALQDGHIELKDNTGHIIVAIGTLHAQNGLMMEILCEIREHCRNQMRQR